MRSLTRALALAAICALLCAALATGVAAYDDFPYPGLDPDALIVDDWGFYKATCTSFVCWRMIEINGVDFSNRYGGKAWGDASHWDDAARSLGITVDDIPAVGAIAQTDGGSELGHVAWVAAVDGDQVTIEEYNFLHLDDHGRWTGSRRYNLRTVPSSAFCYIHVKDLEGTYDIETGRVLFPESETESGALEAAAEVTETAALTESASVTEAIPATEATDTAPGEDGQSKEPRPIMPTVIVIVECVLALGVTAVVVIVKIRAKRKSENEED